ncbi:MAG TPA: GGDEF domain-containing protein, partial [Spirochaetia bacterium]|nr:GGDEF domain-containing protein [Spirochaetia bacterium]
LQKHPEIFSRILHKLLIMIAGRIRSTNKLVSERTPWIEDLRNQLLVDKLTGLYNRTYLTEDLTNRIAQMGETTSLIVIKPDNFKLINDTYGHDAGDRVLRILADTVKGSLREGDIGIRYRGDEFVIVLPDTGFDTALDVGDKLRSAVRSLDITPITEGKKFSLTASVGASAYPIHARDVNGIVERSFNLMLDVRNSGGDRVLGEGKIDG